MRVFQHIDVFHEMDGIGNDILGIQEKLNSLDIENYIIARINDSSKKNSISFEKRPAFKRDDVHILHYGGQGYPIVEFLEFHGRKTLRFHNITPLEFLLPYLPDEVIPNLEQDYKKAKLELISLVAQCEYIWCDSLFNLATLKNWVGKIKVSIEVVPIVREYPISNLHKNEKTIVFIGRWSPNKKIEDLVKILFFLKKIDPEYKIIHIGKRNKFFALYNNYVMNQIQDLELSQSFLICENIPEEERLNYLDRAIAFLCMSEHEGFCIPLLEAMSRNSLVFAYSQDAVEETLNKSGVLINEKDFSKIAFLIHNIINNYKIKNRILDKQKEVVQRFNSFPYINSLKSLLGIDS